MGNLKYLLNVQPVKGKVNCIIYSIEFVMFLIFQFYYIAAHPTCIKMPSKMVKRALEYNWKCAECKTCSKCLRTTDETKMLFCDQCDRGYHIYCLGLRNVPEGKCFYQLFRPRNKNNYI